MKRSFFCESCGAEVASGADRCPSCGRSFLGIRCPRCGREGAASEFRKGCPDCGYLAEESKARFESEAAGRRKPKKTKAPKPVSYYLILSGLVVVAVLTLILVSTR